jgi:hypothetical protein
MAKTDQPESNPTSYLQGDIPVEAMAKLQAAYQASGSSSAQGCPDPESVINYAFEELAPEKRRAIHAHLSECKDCLELVLDLRSAWAETQEKEYIVRERAPVRVQPQSWLAGLVEGMREVLPRIVPLPRLIPAAVAFVVLVVVGIGVLQHLTATRSGQAHLAMIKANPGIAYNYNISAIDKSDKVSLGTSIKRRTNLAFLLLLLEN